MEEILASIRRIIADDQSLPGRGAMEREEPPRSEPPPELRRTPVAPESIEPARRQPNVGPPRAVEQAQAPATPELPSVPVARAAPSVAPEAPAPQPVAEPQAAQPTHGTIFAPQYPMPHQDYAEPESVQPIQAASGPLPPPAAARPQTVGEAMPSRQAVAPEVPPADDDGMFDEPIEPPRQASMDTPPTLFSAATDSSVSAAFNMLAASRLADNSDELMNMVREMIRPLLRNWLDDNLPSMVERMVRAEIERVARGGR